jgi:gamma-glutamyltranspeptidase/glutathione hydrolase
MPTLEFTRSRAAALALSFALAAAAAGCRNAPAPADTTGRPAPTAATPTLKLTPGVAAAHPYAVQAGVEVLRAGGGAADAAVAVQAALGLVEPQSSGLGGGAFMLYYDAQTGSITAFDGRETAPAGATPDMFLDEKGQPLSYAEAVTSGRSTGVPGAIAMLGLAQSKFGRLAWQDLFGTTERLAAGGFVVPQRLGRFANSTFAQATLPDARALFTHPDGTVIKAGDTLRNPAYAETLRTIAKRGPRALLEGPLAAAIVERTHAGPRPGTLTLADMAAYQPVENKPLCRPYRIYVICVPPPPSSGVGLLEVLGLLERTDIASRGPDDPQAWLLFAEASRLMYADRDQYVADPRFTAVPVEGLLDSRYLEQRAQLIGTRAAATAPVAGSPPGAVTTMLGRDATLEVPGTSHFVIVDDEGDVVSVTSTVESLFGSGRAVGGFFLNNQLTDFSFKPVDDAGRPVANAVAGGKRPRSSMAPAIVLRRDNGAFVAAVGSPGGSAILAYNAKVLVGLLAWDLPLQSAINLPNVIARGADFYGEMPRISPALAAQLAEKGVVLKSGRGEESGLHGVAVRGTPPAFEAGADPRREGVWQAR